MKCDLLLQCCKTKYLEKQVKQIVTKSATFADVLVFLERQYPTHENDLSGPRSRTWLCCPTTLGLPGFPSCLPTLSTG